MKISKIVLWAAVIVIVSLLILTSVGFKITKNSGGSGDYSSLPEKCRPTQGYTEESWKEHLGHHAETQDCLKYFK